MADKASSQPPRKRLSDYPDVMTLADYCQYYGISRPTAQKWIAEGRATRVPGHRHVLILKESVRRYEESLLESGADEKRDEV